MENFNDRAYDAWRTRHWTDEPEPDLPEIYDPRVVDVWEEAEDEGDGRPLPRYARVWVKIKPFGDESTEVLSYYDYLEEWGKFVTPAMQEASRLMKQLFVASRTMFEKLETIPFPKD